MRRCLCILIANILLLTLVGCRETSPDVPSQPGTQPVTPPPETTVPQLISLPYDQTASLDPYATTSRLNADLATLLYEQLVFWDDAWMPQPQLAQSFVAEGGVLTVILREGAVFSDGSPVTAADVVYSYGKAAASTQYKALVSVFTACRAEGQQTAVFTLRNGGENAAAALAFPIVKKPDKKSAPTPPIGSGVYTLSQDGTSLVRNVHNTADTSNTTVRLYHVDREDMLLHTLESGHVTYYFDTLSDGTLPRSSKAGLAVEMPYLVYLGINGYSVPPPAVRQALSHAIDRTTLVQSAYTGYARAAVTPFHPLWKRTAGLYTFSAVASVSKADALLESAGYRGNANSKKKELKLELIYVQGNDFKESVVQAIVQQMAAVCVTVTPVALSYNEYLSRLQNGRYQLYLGEIRLPHVSDLSALFSGAAASGVRADGAAAAAYTQYANGSGSLDAFLAAFGEDMPFIPLCYRKGQVLFHRFLGTVAPLANNVYYRLEQWTVS